MIGGKPMRSKTRRALLAFASSALALAAAAPVRGELLRCPATRDVWLSAATREEADTNGGRSPRIKLKVTQEFGLFEFDVSSLFGKKISKAYLRLAPDGGEKFGRGRGTDLRWFTVSTVSSPWEEGRGRVYEVDRKGKGATFNEASFGLRPWTVPGSRVWDAALGNGNTLREDVDAGHPAQGWFSIPLPPRLVEALVAGASYGLLVMDGSTDSDRNCYVSSREGRRPPSLDVEVAGEDRTAPSPPSDLKILPAPRLATPGSGAAQISFTVPEGAFAYRVRLNGAELPRWRIPFAASAGSRQEIRLEDLPPLGELQVEVAAVGGGGNASAYVSATGAASPRLEPPPLSAAPPRRSAAPPPALGSNLRVWAFPELCKLDPVSVTFALEEDLADARSVNAVWDASAAAVRLSGARGEIVGFQLALEAFQGGSADAAVRTAGLGDVGVRLWRTWFVQRKGRWEAEYALPLAQGELLSIPGADNGIAGQRAAVVAVDLLIPPSARPGRRRGTIEVSRGNAPPAALALELEIFPATLPDEVRFNPELNCYGGTGSPGSEFFFDLFRLAHYHRCTLNRVSHSHLGHTDQEWVPAVNSEGRVTDWTTYDRNFGPLLDGSAFGGNPRKGVPVPTFYLPHNENWPLRMVEHYKPGVPVLGPDWKPLHDIFGKPPEQAFSRSYQTAFSNSVADFAKHFEARGWTRTAMQAYFNNKWRFNSKELKGTAWDMDEPTKYLDWHALKFFSRLFHSGRTPAHSVKFVFRGDISRPMWQGSLMDGLMQMMYSNADQFRVPEIMKDHRRRMPAQLYAYGECNPPERSNFETVLWCLTAYLHGCDGVLPWQSLGQESAFLTGDTSGTGNALLVDGRKRFGRNAIASYRVHALRAGAQLSELLRLLEEKNGWNRSQSLAVVSPFLPVAGRFEQRFHDEAGPLTFPPVGGNALTDLRTGLLRALAR
jgi:hypothetical protein